MRKIVFLLLVIFIGSGITPIQASIIEDQKNVSGIIVPVIDVFGDEIFKQGVTVGISGRLDSIEVFVPNYFSYSDYQVEIMSMITTDIRLYSGTSVLHDPDSPSFIIDFSYTEILMEAGDIFDLWIGANFHDNYQLYNSFSVTQGDSYDGGHLTIISPGTEYAFPTWDLRFITYVDDGISAVPEPGTIFLLGFGLLGVAGFGRQKETGAC